MTKRAHLSRRKELIKSIHSSGALPRGLDPEAAASAVMCTLSIRLNRGEAVDLLNSMPEDVRPLFETCATHRTGDHGMRFDVDQFFGIVGKHLGVSDEQAENLTRVVFQAIRPWIPQKEFKDIESELSKDLKRVWRAA